MVTDTGRHEPMPFHVLVDMVSQYAYRQFHVAYSERGVRIGLPPDVATIHIGAVSDLKWYNVRKGYVPEQKSVSAKIDHEWDDVLEILEGTGTPLHVIEYYRARMARTTKKVHTLGWRETVFRMLREGAVRPNPIAEEWLGSREYDNALKRRGRKEVETYG